MYMEKYVGLVAPSISYPISFGNNNSDIGQSVTKVYTTCNLPVSSVGGWIVAKYVLENLQ